MSRMNCVSRTRQFSRYSVEAMGARVSEEESGGPAGGPEVHGIGNGDERDATVPEAQGQRASR